MNKEEQVKLIREFLQGEYSLDLEVWVSFNELIDSGYTLSENAEVLTRRLKDLMSEYPQEFRDRLTPRALEKLTFDLSTEDFEEGLRQLDGS